MPWGEKSVERLREEFVIAAKCKKQTISSLCAEFNISRKTGYKWLNRDNCLNQSRKPHHSPSKTDMLTEKAIVAMRQDNPCWGAKKIHKVLSDNGYYMPCPRTVVNILKRNDCINYEESLKHKAFTRFEREKCNELWQADFKGDFALKDGNRCFPLTILDDHSRFSIAIDPKLNTLGVKDSFEKAFILYGLPDTLMTDNGWTFAGFKGGYTRLERWLMEHNVLPIHCRPFHPQTQGKIERFHRSMKQELLNHNSFDNLEVANTELQKWRNKYNKVRPHEALKMHCPADVYCPSDKTYTEKVIKFEYSGQHPLRKANNWGYLRFGGFQIFLSETFADTYLEVRPNLLGDSFLVCFRNFVIATIDSNTGELIKRKAFRL